MNKKIYIATVGDNCIDLYDNTGEFFPGGNPVNVAVYIKRMQGNSSYTGVVGTDKFGRFMVDSNVCRNCYEFFICDSCFKFS